MKKKTVMRSCLALLLALMMVCSLVACTRGVEKTGVWENATYTKDTELGSGEKTVTVLVVAEEQTVTFTIHTDKTTLREAMEEHDLIDGDESVYGLMVEVVNGMTVKYEDGGYWWGITKNGVTTDTGVDGITIADGEQYEFTKTNQY